jgi:hypothetical protein
MTKKQKKFVHVVGVLVPLVVEWVADGKVLPIDTAACVAKAWSVTDRELSHTHGKVSDKAVEFIYYQLYITDDKPVWYEGANTNRDE